MASDRFFDPSVHERLIEIIDEVSDVNVLIQGTLRMLDDRPELADEIRLLMLRCTALVREAVELHSSKTTEYTTSFTIPPPRSPASEGSGSNPAA